MNGFEALELMRTGKKVVSKESGCIYFLNEGKIYIERKTLDHFKCCFDFNGEYELYEKTYTGLEAIELMKRGYTVSSTYGKDKYVFKLHNDNIYLLYPSGNMTVEESFDFSVKYKIYND